MIVWLASYPRSGNTLLRTLLHQCFGVETCDDETGTRLLGALAVLGVGAVPLESNWDDFYPSATSSKHLKFVKTHKYPRDDQPAIYVHRDGRLAIQSYFDFYYKYVSNIDNKSLLSFIEGDDYYGGWSSHYGIWSERNAPTLILSFEELVTASQNLVEKIGEFIGLNPIKKDWVNPIGELRSKQPDFFRTGSLKWEPVAEWTEDVNMVFNYLHGDLMVRLNYLSRDYISSSIKGLDPMYRQVLNTNNELSKRCAMLQFHCDERLRVIRQLSLSNDSLIEKI